MNRLAFRSKEFKNRGHEVGTECGRRTGQCADLRITRTDARGLRHVRHRRELCRAERKKQLYENIDREIREDNQQKGSSEHRKTN